ncbi:MAG TPA: hypothetical protein VFT59_01445, partial [Candidatus Saccharimonadales bacterium]|nr:hypothetical protein [Candidatus Saccharimonadales bacterium]
FWTDILKDDAIETGKKQAEALASQSDVQTLQQIQAQLLEDESIVERARSIVADSQSYQYQDQIIKDITDYATRAGIGISNIDFSATTTAAPSGTASQQQTAPAPTGVKSSSVSVTIKNPVDYNALLRFIHSIEQNLTKMQISGVGISKETTGNVTSDALVIEVFVR